MTVLPCNGTPHLWCVLALVRAVVAMGDANIILDLMRMAAPECCVKRGTTVIIDDTTEYDSKSNGVAEVAVREVNGVARSIRVTLSELYKKDISSKHPVALARLLRGWPDHACADWSRRDDTPSEVERENIPQTTLHLRRACPLPPHRLESKSTPRTPE